jgi:hypothetical protein
LVEAMCFNLRAEIEIIMNEKSKTVPKISDAEWILYLAFLVDITFILNELNMKFQRKGKLLLDVFSEIKAFKMKLKMINKHIEEQNFVKIQ